jgi:mRNA-degrading endonuclease RelE of RelBE toxin-antitoxin system
MKSFRQLGKIKDRQTAEMIYDAVEELKNWPECKNIKALTNHQYNYRLRIGSWRVFFDVSKTIKIIAIQEVKKRDERTY